MNLIEQLGGYENARAMRDSNIDSFDGDASGVRIHYMGDCFYQEDLDLSLLKYRRQHNIFEVGDKVVCLYGQDSTFLTKDEIYTVKEVCYGGTHVTLKLQENYDGGDSSYSVNRFNHATDAEIKACKRLEVGDA